MRIITTACDVLPFLLIYHQHYYMNLSWVPDMVCIGSQSHKEGLSQH
jgi:hypothetical protein